MLNARVNRWLALAAIALLALAAAVVVVVVIPRQQHQQWQNKNAANIVSLMLVNHLHEHRSWPQDWDDLKDDYAFVVTDYHHPLTWQELQQRVDVCFELDLVQYDFSLEMPDNFVVFTTSTGGSGDYGAPFVWSAIVKQRRDDQTNSSFNGSP